MAGSLPDFNFDPPLEFLQQSQTKYANATNLPRKQDKRLISDQNVLDVFF